MCTLLTSRVSKFILIMNLIVLQINFALLQASVVEEVISFSALDNLRDLTCVSLLAVSFEGVTTRFHCGKQVIILQYQFERTILKRFDKFVKNCHTMLLRTNLTQ